MPTKPTQINNPSPRPPVVCIMGHVDHGKSTLLQFVKKINITDSEAGGITQKIGAYEIEHIKENGEIRAITFLDTPGHEAFKAIRARGASVADIAILLVSAEDGVKPQTIDAYKCIVGAKIPYLVAINKIDKPGADVERTKQSLAENEIYLEGYGGDVPWSAISAKTGEGIPAMLEIIDLLAEMSEIKGDETKSAEGFIIESHLDARRGPAGSLVVKNGTLRKGDFLVSGLALAPVRIMEDDKGKNVDVAIMGKPIRITGWSQIPEAGLPFQVTKTKKEAEVIVEKNKLERQNAKGVSKNNPIETAEGTITIPIIIKADATGTIDAILHELKEIQSEKTKLRLISQGIGEISESDAKKAESVPGTVIIGFNSKMDNRAKAIAERSGILIKEFDIIYKLSEWLVEFIQSKTPKVKVEEKHGMVRVLKLFGKEKNRQIVGGKVLEGTLYLGDEVKISRREAEIGIGKVKELQKMKKNVDEVSTGTEFGTLIESTITIAEGDIIEPFKIVEK